MWSYREEAPGLTGFEPWRLLATPMSASFAPPSPLVTSTLEVFRSRCTKPWACRYDSPAAACDRNTNSCRRDSAGRASYRSKSEQSISSVTKAGMSCSVRNTPRNWTMHGCWRRCIRSHSLENLARKSSRPKLPVWTRERWRTFTATGAPCHVPR